MLLQGLDNHCQGILQKHILKFNRICPTWKYLGQQEVLRTWLKKSHIRNNFALTLYPILLTSTVF